jgi:hypothetical protein
MAHPAGLTLPLSLPCRYRCDLLALARQVPTLTTQRRLRLGVTLAARAIALPRPAWLALFTKAYALVAQNLPALRRVFLSFPRPRLYQHPVSVALVPLERPFLGEDAIFYATMAQPEVLSLVDLDSQLRRYKEQPLEKLGAFRRSLLFSRLPHWMRKGLWWATCNAFGVRKVQTLGTFAVTDYSGLGAEAVGPLTLTTSGLTYGVMERDGSVDVRIRYDARVLDGPTVARALAELERILTQEIVAELRYLEDVASAA